MVPRLFLTVLLCSLLCSAQPQNKPKIPAAATLNATTRSMPFPQALGIEGFWSYWQDDHFVMFATKPGGPNRAGITIYDHDGRFDRDIVVWSPEAIDMSLRDAVVTTDGTVLVAGAFLTGNDKLKRFIAEPGNGDTFRRVIWTDRFQALAICPMKDGTLWVYGDKPWDPNEKGYSVLRHYSFEKGLLGEVLPESSLPNPHMMGSLPHHDYFLVADNDRILGLDIGAEAWFELDPVTSKLTIMHVIPLPRTANLQGAALLTSGEAYATFLLPSEGDKPRGGVYQLVKKADTASWVPIKGTSFVKMSEDNFRGFLSGSDGDELVFRKQTDSGTEVQWARPDLPSLSMK